jgi:hypothetical protein
MSIEEIKIHNCNNNTTIFNTDDWIKNDDFIKFAKSKQQKIDQLEREVEDLRSGKNTMVFGGRSIGKTYLQSIEKENQQLKERNKELERFAKIQDANLNDLFYQKRLNEKVIKLRDGLKQLLKTK